MNKNNGMRKPETRLEKAVARWLKDRGRDYSDGIKGAYRDLEYGGCESGMVSGLIYYHDTLKFYKHHREDINELLKEMLFDTGGSINDLFGDKWDKKDPLALDTQNQNLLAWFGFEEAARNLMNTEE